MSAFDYSAIATKAQALIDKFGRNVVFSTKTRAAGDAVAGTVTTTTASATVKAVLFDYTMSERGIAFAKDVVIMKGDKKCIVAGITPTLNMAATFGGDAYSVLNIKELNPAGTNLYYELMLRK